MIRQETKILFCANRLPETELRLRHSLRQAIDGGDVEAARKLLSASRFASLLDTPDSKTLPWDAESAPTAAAPPADADDSSGGNNDSSRRRPRGSGGDEALANGSWFPPAVQGGHATSAPSAAASTDQVRSLNLKASFKKVRYVADSV